MPLLSLDQLANLTQTEEPSISIYLPTERRSKETRQNPIRFKNLIRQAEEQLIEQGLKTQEAHQLLQAAHELDTYDFWQHQSDGLAIFISPSLFRYYRLPLDFEELAVVSDRFHLKPLLSLFTGDGQFYLLALSQNQVRLFQGSRFSISEVELENVPQGIAEALRYDDPEQQLQFHTRTQPARAEGDRAAIFHGQGGGEDDAKENILRYFRKVNQGIDELLKGQQIPLVLAGVEYLQPIYREANTYPHLLDKGVTGNPDILKAEELHSPAWEAIEPYFQQAQQEVIERYQELAGTGQTSNALPEVVSTAYYQRVDSLLVPVGIQQWGAFDPQTNQVEVHSEQKVGDEDLIDLAAIHTLLNGGKVYAVEPEAVPNQEPVAAVFRYAS
uniref:Uncharacterized protein n=1 Tax=Desertifilum tharense IPPAS B-1220 TaxID=1781255 RepID=A0ACD5GVZ3_9CYAN